MTRPTPPAPIPDSITIGTLAVFGDAQTGQLDRANADKAEILDFDKRCRARDAEFAASLTKRRRLLGIF